MITRKQLRALDELRVGLDRDLESIDDVVLFEQGFRIDRGHFMIKRSFRDNTWDFNFCSKSRPYAPYWVEVEVRDLAWENHPELINLLSKMRKWVAKEWSVREPLQETMSWLRSYREHVRIYIDDYYWQILNEEYTSKVGDSRHVNGVPQEIVQIEHGFYYFKNGESLPVKYMDVLNAGGRCFVLEGNDFRRLSPDNPRLMAEVRSSRDPLKLTRAFNSWMMIEDKKFLKQEKVVI